MSVMTAEDVLTVLRADAAERDAKYKAEQAERDAKYKAEQEKRDAEQAKRDAEYKERFERIQQLTGSFKLNLGEIIEIVMMPKLRAEVNKCGHEFYVMSPNKRFEKRDGSHLAEVDLLLENGDEVMAVEIKSNCKDKDIERHIERLEKLRKNEDITGMKGRTIYAAIATMTIKEDVRDMALDHGMYVITVREEEDRVDVIQPETKGQW